MGLSRTKLVLYAGVLKLRISPRLSTFSRTQWLEAEPTWPNQIQMRLVQIKLAGFKSFVDPTSIAVPGNLVGVVGPNGCGKSNIIDAVRWVLGESRASALRGDSMQDVIFNGSSKRSPVARASVELLFDNSLGRAAGQWSQYAEVSVKRVLERNGESSYFINNVHVRRRDVHDIFLGTGLGPRAYAIIEQGMISRIVEAKPEELRIFLEEAAGVSKYKERRRETENRLSDTRENLARVDDIRQELGAQIEKLAQQAEVAGKFKQLSEERSLKQGQLWLLRKRESAAELERTSREIGESTISLERSTAALRDAERRLDEVREKHYAASDASAAAQSALFEVNSEISRLEAEVRSIVERRTILNQGKSDQENSLVAAKQRIQELESARALWDTNLEKSRLRISDAESGLQLERVRLSEAETAWRVCREALTKKRDEVAHASQALSLAQAGMDHAGRMLSALGGRLERARAERDSLVAPDPAVGNQILSELNVVERALDSAEARLRDLDAERTEASAARATKDSDARRLERELASLEAQLSTLRSIQDASGDDVQTQEWLQSNSLSSRPRFWQKLTVTPGWEMAFESALGERLHAIELDSDESLGALLNNPPPVRLNAYVQALEQPLPIQVDNLPGTALVDLVATHEDGVRPVLAAWLADYRAVEVRPDLHERLSLDSRLILITRDGHQYSRFGVTIHAAGSSDGGVLERQREIEALQRECIAVQSMLQERRTEVDQLDHQLAALVSTQSQVRAECGENRSRIHKLRLGDAEFRQSVARHRERMDSLSKSISEISAEMEAEQLVQSQTERKLSLHQSALTEARSALEAVSNELSQLEGALSVQRDAVSLAERALQEAKFSSKECELKLDEIRRALETSVAQTNSNERSIEAIARELSELNDQPIRTSLESALSRRAISERELSEKRNIQEELGAALKALEAERSVNDALIGPLRERLSELKLKQQAAQLAVQQYSSLLTEAKVDESLASSTLREGQKPTALQTEINRLTAVISELGPVNMAALGELETSRERKDFLDLQASDLSQALETLESAIRKIDRETRDLLQSTFDKVNHQFGLMFPALFGGGEAKLVMTGEEVLDSGVQVLARPPGKKNSTIHLLSGGEKALTAISLVFSMFQLNPAPFCLLDEVDAPLDDANTVRFCDLVRCMAQQTQFLFISHNKLTMELASQLIGVTMQEQGVSRVVAVDIDEAMRLREPIAA